MWQIIAARFSARAGYYLAFPFAVIIGTIGVYAEQKYRGKYKEIPYLETSRIADRDERLMERVLTNTEVDSHDPAYAPRRLV